MSRGRPRKQSEPPPVVVSAPDDPTPRLIAMIDKGVRAVDDFCDRLIAGGDPDDATKILAIVKDSGALLGHIRRHEQAQIAVGKLTPAAVLAWLKQQPEEVRTLIADELGVEAAEAAGSVLS